MTDTQLSAANEHAYRKKPVAIEAWRLGSEQSRPEWAKWDYGNGHDYAEVVTLGGRMRGERGDWLIRGVKGELYFCKPDIFALTYDHMSDVAQPEQLRLEWRDGAPSKPWALEWFIAETTFGDRVCLVALPDEWTYDFKTADDTYIKADKIKRWMQFPDSNFIAPASQPSPVATVETQKQIKACMVALEDVPGETLADRVNRLVDWYQALSNNYHKDIAEAHNGSSAASGPVAFVPIHPRQGPLWSDTFPAGSEVHRSNSYPRMALYAAEPQTAAVREALELAEDVLSRSPFSTAIWPNGMHPNRGIEKIRAALRSRDLPQRPAGNAGVIRLLTKIADLVDDEDAGEPLDDAIRWANEALAILNELQASAANGDVLADRIEGMAGLGILSRLDNSGQLDLNGQLSDADKQTIVDTLRLTSAEPQAAAMTPLSTGEVQSEFYAWWEANQVDRLHGMIAQNCALAAWHDAYDRYVRSSQVSREKTGCG